MVSLVTDLDDTLMLVERAKEIGERMKARAEAQSRDQVELDRVLSALGARAPGGFTPGFRQLPTAQGDGFAQGSVALGTSTVKGPSISVTVGPRFEFTSGAVAVRVSHSGHALPAAVEDKQRRFALIHGFALGDQQQKYDQILQLIASKKFNVGMAACALYGDDNDRTRNRVRAGVNHLRERGLVERHPDGSLTVIRRRKVQTSS